MNFINPDYKKFYSIYKKMPAILSIVTAVLVLAWSIIDVTVFSNTYYSYYYSRSYYGIMGLESAFLVLIIWWAIGAVLSASVWFFSTLTVSATVTRTDATLDILKSAKQTSADESTYEALPEL